MSARYGEIIPQNNTLAFGAVTGTNTATANTVLTLSSDCDLICVKSTLNNPVILQYNSKVLWKFSSVNETMTFDLRTNEKRLFRGRTISVYNYSSPSTSGEIQVTAL